MSRVPYDPEHMSSFFDEYGEREWVRFDATAMDRVGLEVHLRLLREHIRPGMRVLDAGAGPGRFSLELARLGATVVAGDISRGSSSSMRRRPRASTRRSSRESCSTSPTSAASTTSPSTRWCASAGR